MTVQLTPLWPDTPDQDKPVLLRDEQWQAVKKVAVRHRVIVGDGLSPAGSLALATILEQYNGPAFRAVLELAKQGRGIEVTET